MPKATRDYTKEELQEALRAISSVIQKIEKAQKHFAKGTPQRTLAKNRLKTFRIASVLIKELLRKS